MNAKIDNEDYPKEYPKEYLIFYIQQRFKF